MIDKSDGEFWSARYLSKNTGWDIGSPSTPLVEYVNQLNDKELKVLIPGAGNAYEAEYMHLQGFKNIYVLDIAFEPLEAFRIRVPDFPQEHLIQDDFFKHSGNYDLIIEQTFFCSFDPSPMNREQYAEKMHNLLGQKGKLVGLWFKHPLVPGSDQRPFGGSKEEYLSYLEPFFNVITFTDSYNSIPPRSGNELFGIFQKK